MSRNFVCLCRAVIAVVSVVAASQGADAQLYGSACCGGSGYGGYSSAYASAPISYGYSSMVPAYYGYPSAISYGVSPYSYGGYGCGSTCNTGCGLFGHFRRRCATAFCCDSPSYYQASYCGIPSCGMTSHCYVRPRRARLLGCRPRAYTYACGTVACCLPSPIYTGAVATCCAPVASSCTSTGFSSYPMDSGYSTSIVPAMSTPALSTSPTPAAPATETAAKPMDEPAADPAPPKEPVAPAPAPETDK